MNLLRWSRRAVAIFIAAFLLGLAALALTHGQAVRDVAFWLCLLSIPGLVGASILALSAQIAGFVRRRKGGQARHG